MGVHGLWRLIEPSGKPVPLESLENKILAVDISIWLHQAIKGFQDSRGAPLPNAHLLGIYHRVCKLLYFRVKPIFVFDGGVPVLKKQTIAKRNDHKCKILNDASDIQTKLLKTLLKYSAVNKVISDKSNSPEKSNRAENESNDKNDMFILPAISTELDLDSTLESYSSTDESSSSPTKQWDLHTIDEKSEHFRSLPADVRHEILTDIRETRKQSSWGRMHELPTESNDFSSFQMKRLLKRFSVQTSLEEAIKEMGGHSLSLGELEALLNEEGIVTTSETAGSRIASNENTRYLLIKDVQKAMLAAKKRAEKVINNNEENITEITSTETVIKNTTPIDKEFERDLAAAIQLSLQEQPSTSKNTDSNKDFSFLEKFNDGDFDSESDVSDEEGKLTRLTQAKSYMMEYSGLTPAEIDKIINGKAQSKRPVKKQKEFTDKQSNSYNEKVTDIVINLSAESTSNITEKMSVSLQTNIISTPQLNSISEVKFNSDLKTSKCFIEVTKVDSSIAEIVSDSDDKFVHKIKDQCDKNVIEDNKKKVGKDISESEDSDFIEVETEENNRKIDNKTSLEIVIDTKNNLDDDIFSDIFAETPSVITEKTVSNKTIEEIAKVSSSTEKNNNSENALVESTTDVEIVNEEKNNQLEKLNNKIVPDKPLLTVEELSEMKSNLAHEQRQLLTERNAKERMAGNITDQMYQEAQELLELFGVPYIIAPMEAESQCAFLNEIDLTDGTITDDSDIWLFGGKTVYKNFFNHNKHVLQFRSDSIEHHFKLSREQLILLALLVGSDYTTGIQGIGPVTALEILASFPPSRHANINVLAQAELVSGLKEFRRWLSDNKCLGIGRTTLRSKLRNVNISEGFPNLQVVQAYLQPEVETCRDQFTWGKPDFVSLIDFAKEKFGWTKLKSEEILKPVMKKLDDKNIQKTIKDYFSIKHKIDVDLAESKMSKRVKTAVKRMGSNHDKSDSDEALVKNKAIKKKRNPRKRKNEDGPVLQISKKNVNLKVSKEKAEQKIKLPAKTKEQLHIKETIPQKERAQKNALKTKLRAIEIFRKSKQGPGFIPKRVNKIRNLKDEAELSESRDRKSVV